MMASRLGLGGLALNFKVTAKQNRSNLSVCGEDRGGGGGGGGGGNLFSLKTILVEKMEHSPYIAHA